VERIKYDLIVLLPPLGFLEDGWSIGVQLPRGSSLKRHSDVFLFHTARRLGPDGKDLYLGQVQNSGKWDFPRHTLETAPQIRHATDSLCFEVCYCLRRQSCVEVFHLIRDFPFWQEFMRSIEDLLQVFNVMRA
jgi:hypothetical protein